jgi:PAS domain S-box-containing protein
LDAARADYLDLAPRCGRGHKLFIFAIEFSAILALYSALAELSVAAPFAGIGVTPLWPPSGIAFAILLLRGSPVSPALATGAFLGSLSTGHSLTFSAALGCGTAISALVAAQALKRWSDPNNSFETVEAFLKFCVACLIPAAGISSAFCVAGSILSDSTPIGETLSIWPQWWLADGALSIATGSFVFLWGFGKLSMGEIVRACLIALLTIGLTIIAFWPPQRAVSLPSLDVLVGFDGAPRNLTFLVVVPLTWAALRGDSRLVASTAFAFVGSAAWALSSPDRSLPSNELLFFVALSLIASIPSMTFAVAFVNRRRRERQLVAARDELDRELKRVGSSLETTRRQFNTLIEDVTDHVIFLVDRAGRVASWNEGAGRIIGYSQEEIIGKPFAMFYRADERRAGEPLKALELAIHNHKHEVEGWRVRKDGTPFFVTGVISAIFNQAGELVGFSSLMRDTTERRQAQEKLLEAREQLAMAQKMEAIGKLTGGIAHDFNNLLMIIGGNAQTFKRLLDPKLPRAVEAIQTAAKRGEKLTRQLLTFSRSQHLSPTVVDLPSVLQNLRPMIESSLRGNIIYNEDIGGGSIFTKIDVAELELAIVNLAVNARDAMPNGGTFTLSLSRVECTPELQGLRFDRGLATIQVRDTGTGIPPNLLSKIFDPFFTTKDVGKGTGLGLSQVYGFARQSGGTINVESEIGQGTTFTLYVPICSASELTTPAAQKNSRAKRPKVLVVDDSPDVAEVTSSLFEQLGYDTTYRDSGEKALEYLQQGEPVDLVLSDIVMPGNIDGVGLANELLVRYPKVPIILTTGYSDAAQSVPSHLHVIRKPFDSEMLSETVQKVLERV